MITSFLGPTRSTFRNSIERAKNPLINLMTTICFNNYQKQQFSDFLSKSVSMYYLI